LASSEWIWHDTDKKGRPRQRDCRPDLQHLELLSVDALTQQSCLAYRALIDPAGRSLRPEQLQHWLAEHLGQPLEIVSLRRESLQLQQS
jgi:hypothetical protein